MLSVNEAITILLDSGKRLVESEKIDLIEASGRTLASDIIAPIDVPPADNSAMDGYAIRFGDWSDAQAPIRLSQRITAGSVPAELKTWQRGPNIHRRRSAAGRGYRGDAGTLRGGGWCCPDSEIAGPRRQYPPPGPGSVHRPESAVRRSAFESTGPGPGRFAGYLQGPGLPAAQGGRDVDGRRIARTGRRHPARPDIQLQPLHDDSLSSQPGGSR